MASSRQKNSPPETEEAGPSRGRRATSYDVARLAGVSQSAVSRCFKAGASVSARMRERVMRAAAELEYQPNAIARGLITQRSNLVAVLVSGRLNLYYPEVIMSLTGELDAVGLRVLLFTVDSEADSEAVIEQAWQYRVDGLISASHLSRAQLDLLEKRDIPVVFFNRYFVDRPANVVYCDPQAQVDLLIDRLVTLGHRRFGLVQGPQSNMVGRERARLVRAALGRHGLSHLVEAEGDFTYDSGGAALQALMSETHWRPTAIISVNDMMALGAMDEARSVLELRIPDDLSVAGFDGIGVARFASYELTTIRQPIGRMCKAAVSLVRARIENPDQSNERRVFEGALIEGGSIGPPPT